MAEFMVDIWDGNVENRHVAIEDFSTIKGWGTPVGTVTAILTKARWGECADMPGDYRRRSDAMTINGDGGIWEGTMGGRHFRIRNLAFFPKEEKKRRKKSDAYQEARAGRVVDQPIAYQGVNIAPGQWQVVERQQLEVQAAPAAFWYDAVQPHPLQGNIQAAPVRNAAVQQAVQPHQPGDNVQWVNVRPGIQQMDQAAYEADFARIYNRRLQEAAAPVDDGIALQAIPHPVQEDEH